MKILSKNKKAHFNYFVEDKIETGIILLGTEVKSCMMSGIDLSDGYIHIKGNSVILKSVHISKYENRGYADHDEKRDRILLLHKREIEKIKKKIDIRGYTLVPLCVYYSNKKKIKVEIGICKGKKNYDKRETLKKKQSEMDAKREIKQR